MFPPGIIEIWDDASIKLRLAHLRSKASYVRELVITDHGVSPWGRMDPDPMPRAFPEEFIPELLDTLRVLHSLTVVHLVTHTSTDSPNPPLSIGIWNWLLDVRPTKFVLSGNFQVADGQISQPIETLDGLEIKSYGVHNKAIVDVCYIQVR